MNFRREYKMVDWGGADHQKDCGLRGRVEVVGSVSDCPSVRPYLRIEDGSGNYIGSVEGSTLRHLKNALVRALSPDQTGQNQ